MPLMTHLDQIGDLMWTFFLQVNTEYNALQCVRVKDDEQMGVDVEVEVKPGWTSCFLAEKVMCRHSASAQYPWTMPVSNGRIQRNTFRGKAIIYTVGYFVSFFW